MGSRRIKRELDQFTKNPPPYCIPGPIDNVRLHWTVTVVGPEDTPYAGAEFPVSILFPPDYPMTPPKVIFARKIYHPNISVDDGRIYLEILRPYDELAVGQWSPFYTISRVFSNIVSSLTHPDLEKPANPGAAAMFKKNRPKYNATVQTWLQIFH